MIYLIKSAGYREEEEMKYFPLLKIGYTEDSRKEVRYSHYKMHNPTCQVLCEIPGATEDHEKRVQYKFRDLIFSDYGREWFEYSEEIIEFFKNIVSLEELDNLPKGNTDRGKYSNHKKNVKNILGYLTDIMQDTKEFRELCEETYNILGDKITNESYVMEYLESKFGKERIERYNKIQKSIRTGIFCEDDLVNQEVSEFIKKYFSKTTIMDKFRLLCESGLSKEVIEIVLAQIPDSDEVKSYYVTLGPQRLYSLGYNVTKIRKAMGVVMFSPELLRDSVYSDFKEGEKLSLTNIKNRLSYIYSSINYNSTPKATDIERWFEVKECLVSVEVDGKKKRSRGYELLKSKRDTLEERLCD